MLTLKDTSVLGKDENRKRFAGASAGLLPSFFDEEDELQLDEDELENVQLVEAEKQKKLLEAKKKAKQKGYNVFEVGGARSLRLTCLFFPP